MTTTKSKNARQTAHSILLRVEVGDAYPDILLQKELDDFSREDKGLITELVYGVLRWQIKIDWIINLFSKIKVKKLEHNVLIALRLGTYQLLFLNRIPPQAAINESVNLVKKGSASTERSAGFVNAILRTIDANKMKLEYPEPGSDAVKFVSITCATPEWIAKRWIERYGIQEAIKICQSTLEPPPKILRTNTLIQSRAELISSLREEGIAALPSKYSPEAINVTAKHKTLNNKDKRFYIQEEASQLIAHIVAPKKNENILDACAAPGGKTTHMAELMKNSGSIVAMDKYKARLTTLSETLKRFDITNTDLEVWDATTPLNFQPSLFHGNDKNRSNAANSGFDAILIDAPCSGLGVIRRTPDIKLKRKPEDIPTRAKYQGQLLENLSSYVKIGGRIVYSTCTFEPEETYEVIEKFLSEHSEFSVEDIGKILEPECSSLITKEGYFRSTPHLSGMDGFFAVRIKRNA